MQRGHTVTRPVIAVLVWSKLVSATICAAATLVCDSAFAQPATISISSGYFSTYVSAEDEPGTGHYVFRSKTSPSPIHDELSFPNGLGGDADLNWAIADAGFFSVSVKTGWGKADASAVANIKFTSLIDQPIGLNLSRGGRYFYTAGWVTLTDLTLNSTSWSYGWSQWTNNVPWQAEWPLNAEFGAGEPLVASHDYELQMALSSNAGSDSQFAHIGVIVPEPAASRLLLLALLGMPAASRISRRWRRRSPGQPK